MSPYYHTALEFQGKAYSTFSRVFYFTEHRTRPCTIASHTFRGVLVPKALRAKGKGQVCIKEYDRSGLSVPVANLERTLVDVLDRPELSGGWEEIWRSLESVEFFNLDMIIEYALFLDNSTTIAKVGYFLEQHRESLMVEDAEITPRDLETQLLPLLDAARVKNLGDPEQWATTLVDDCRRRLNVVLPLAETEMKFLDQLLDYGESVPSMLTDDEQMAGRIGAHPLLRWKALNVRQHRGKNGGGD